MSQALKGCTYNLLQVACSKLQFLSYSWINSSFDHFELDSTYLFIWVDIRIILHILCSLFKNLTIFIHIFPWITRNVIPLFGLPHKSASSWIFGYFHFYYSLNFLNLQLIRSEKKCFTFTWTSSAWRGVASTSSMKKSFFNSHSTATLHFITWKLNRKVIPVYPHSWSQELWLSSFYVQHLAPCLEPNKCYVEMDNHWFAKNTFLKIVWSNNMERETKLTQMRHWDKMEHFLLGYPYVFFPPKVVYSWYFPMKYWNGLFTHNCWLVHEVLDHTISLTVYTTSISPLLNNPLSQNNQAFWFQLHTCLPARMTSLCLFAYSLLLFFSPLFLHTTCLHHSFES